MNPRWTGLAKFSSVYLRLALGISFLSAVADRFGFWGVYGQPNVSWGNYARFEGYTAKLNGFLPAAMILALAMIATVGETVLGLLLSGGLRREGERGALVDVDGLEAGRAMTSSVTTLLLGAARKIPALVEWRTQVSPPR